MMESGKTGKKPVAGIKRQPTPTATPVITLAHHLHALLHTVRAIAHVEDELCTLLHAVEHKTDVSRELRQLLAHLPAQDYVVEIEAIQSSLAEAKAPSKAPAKRASIVKKRAKAAKKTA
jgi:hypothetical protein